MKYKLPQKQKNENAICVYRLGVFSSLLFFFKAMTGPMSVGWLGLGSLKNVKVKKCVSAL